ncbi:MAG: OprO/OprP family phosphate-selective porin [Rhizomicrobium sp.]
MFQKKSATRAALLAGAAAFALSSAAFAQTAAPTGSPPPKHRHHHEAPTTGSDRLDLLEKRVEQQADAIEQQADEIKALKAQINQAPTPSQVTSAQFAALENKVDEQDAAKKKQATVVFKPATPFLRAKTVPTISSPDGKWTFAPYAMVQGDWASYSKGQPLSAAGTDNLKSSGENFRRARIGFTGSFDRDFGYNFIYDFGGSNGDETYQAYAKADSGSSNYTASTGAGSGPHIYKALVSYKGILDPFMLEVGLMPTPANLGDATQSDDLLFNERPSPSQLSRGLDGDDGRESAGFIGNGSFWNASLFLTGDTYGKAALIAPATTYGGSQEAVVGRVAVLPWHDPDTNLNIHLGANFGYVIHPQEATSTATPGVTTYGITFSDRPELRVDNVTFLNTGAINAKSAYTAGLEAAASYGPLLIQGENFWYGIERNNPPAGATDPRFSGWYVEGSWVLTGEPHPYNIANASFTRPSPVEPLDPANGAWGAWELAGRYSSSDLDYDITSKTVADRVFGGRQNITSVGLNFYPNDVLRFMLDWQSVSLRNIGALSDNGNYNTVEIRTQVSF